MTNIRKHNIDQVGAIAYTQHDGNKPGVVFLCGHGSDMNGSKAEFLHAWAQCRGQSFLRFDYSGHGQSDGNFIETNISDWTRDTIEMVDAHTDGPQILVGSSLGGWILDTVSVPSPRRGRILDPCFPPPPRHGGGILDPCFPCASRFFVCVK